jgi:hypothetical protein
MMDRLILRVALGLMAGMIFTTAAYGQTAEAPRLATVVRYAVILEEPTRDSAMVGAVEAGTALTILGKVDDYYFVRAPQSDPPVSWENGWILVVAFEAVNRKSAAESTHTPRDGKLKIRGFGNIGGVLFSASDSFETILGGSFNSAFGIGGQVVLPMGLYAQVSYDRLRDTGSRALVSGSQIFTLEIPNRITITPILATVGYQGLKTSGVVPYFGGGVGWYTLDEDSPSIPGSETLSSQHMGYHVVGGAEFPLSRWIALAGEVQWATVPGGIGDSGVSAYFEENDLGGTTFRFKVLFGR